MFLLMYLWSLNISIACMDIWIVSMAPFSTSSQVYPNENMATNDATIMAINKGICGSAPKPIIETDRATINTILG